jgi:hypothetical protein
MRITVLGAFVTVGVVILAILLFRHFGKGPDDKDRSTPTPR